MKTDENITSEEELLKLHNEGRITQEEYTSLLSEIRKPAIEYKTEIFPNDRKNKWYRHKNLAGIVSIILSLGGMLLPLPHVVLTFTNGPMPENVRFNWGGIISIEIVACALGFVSWKTKLGKIGATISSIAIILTVPFIHL